MCFKSYPKIRLRQSMTYTADHTRERGIFSIEMMYNTTVQLALYVMITGKVSTVLLYVLSHFTIALRKKISVL